jgi:hypothetical protein
VHSKYKGRGGPPFKRCIFFKLGKIKKLHTVMKVFSQEKVFRPTLSLIPGSAPDGELGNGELKDRTL